MVEALRPTNISPDLERLSEIIEHIDNSPDPRAAAEHIDANLRRIERRDFLRGIGIGAIVIGGLVLDRLLPLEIHKK